MKSWDMRYDMNIFYGKLLIFQESCNSWIKLMDLKKWMESVQFNCFCKEFYKCQLYLVWTFLNRKKSSYQLNVFSMKRNSVHFFCRHYSTFFFPFKEKRHRIKREKTKEDKKGVPFHPYFQFLLWSLLEICFVYKLRPALIFIGVWYIFSSI